MVSLAKHKHLNSTLISQQSLRFRCKSSMYHSIGNCVFLFLEAVLTFEHEHIVKAQEAISACLAVCNRQRKKNTISESIGKTFKRVSWLRCISFTESIIIRLTTTFFSSSTNSITMSNTLNSRLMLNCVQLRRSS